MISSHHVDRPIQPAFFPAEQRLGTDRDRDVERCGRHPGRRILAGVTPTMVKGTRWMVSRAADDVGRAAVIDAARTRS